MMGGRIPAAVTLTTGCHQADAASPNGGVTAVTPVPGFIAGKEKAAPWGRKEGVVGRLRFRGAVSHGIEPDPPPTFVSLLAAVFWLVVSGLLIVCRGDGTAEWKALGEALCAAGLALWAICG